MILEDVMPKQVFEKKDKDDPCWDGYEKRGTKMKDGKRVNNCVKKESKK